MQLKEIARSQDIKKCSETDDEVIDKINPNILVLFSKNGLKDRKFKALIINNRRNKEVRLLLVSFEAQKLYSSPAAII